MVQKLYVASRKGLLRFSRSNDLWVMERSDFVGDPVSAVLHDPRNGALFAALDLGHFGVKLHRSGDGGESWEELAAPAFPKSEEAGATGGDPAAPSVSLLWTLAAGGAGQPDRLWAGTIPGGLFVSDDLGQSWSLVETLWNQPQRAQWMGGGFDDPGIHSISIHPEDENRIAIGVSTGGVWLTDDGSEHWTLAGKGLRAEYLPPESANDPLMQDVHLLARCATEPDVIWCQHHNGIFRSVDGGKSFREIENARPSAFGFAVAAHPKNANVAWFAPAIKDECRVPVDQKFVVSRTSDGGDTFDVLDKGLPDAPSFDLVYRHALAVDDTGDRLALGTTTGNLWVGAEGGESWRLVSNYLPPISQVLWVSTE